MSIKQTLPLSRPKGSLPKISVVVPVYNTERYLDECVYSILDQKYPSLEVILVDDGSTDSSGVMCDAFEADNPDVVKVVHKPNGGLLMARRTGFAASTGEYVMSVDSDDSLLVGALDAVASMVSRTGADVVRFGFSRDGSCLGFPSPAKATVNYFGSSEKSEVLAMLCRATDGSQNPMWAKAIHRDCLGVDEDFSRFAGLSFAEDFLQTLVVYDRATTFCFADVALYYYRPSLTSMTRDYSPSFFADILSCMEEGERYAADWEFRYSCEGLVAGIDACRLDSASQYAESAACSRDSAALDELRTMPVMDCVVSRGESYSLLRKDRRIALSALVNGRYWELRALATLRRLVRLVSGARSE